MAEDAQIAYPPARVWGCPTTAMWVYRVGAERAKRLLLTGDLVDGREAARLRLVLEAVPAGGLGAAVDRLRPRGSRRPRPPSATSRSTCSTAGSSPGSPGATRTWSAGWIWSRTRWPR